MKRFLIAVSSLVLILPGLSLAQSGPGYQGPPTTKPAPGQPNRPGRPSNGGGNRPTPGTPGGGNRPTPGRPGGGHRPGWGGNRPGTGQPGGGNRPGHGHRPPPGSGHRPPPAGHRPPPHNGHRPGVHRPGHSFYYLGRYRPRYHGGYFAYPRGYAYRRWSNGQNLPSIFLTAAYFFNNYAALGLDSPPYGYQWVRYGPDLLLVELRTGRIADVVPDAVY